MAEEVARVAREVGLNDLGALDDEIKLMHQIPNDTRPVNNIFAIKLLDRGSRARTRPVRFSDWSQKKTRRATPFKRNDKITNNKAYKMLWCTEKLIKATFRPVKPQPLEDCTHICFSKNEYDTIDWINESDIEELNISDIF
jgi:hypothetical protein